MELYLKITAGLLLFVQAFSLASLQDTTDSPGRTIDKSWLRELPKNIAGGQNATVNEEDATATDLSSGTSSGFMNIEEQNVTGHDPNNTYDDDLTGISNTTAPNDTTIQPPEFPATTASSTTTTSVSTDSSQINVTIAENSTVTPQTSSTPSIAKNSTTYPNLSNHTNLLSTTFAPQSNATQEPITKPDDTGLTNSTGSNSTTTATKTTTPQINRTSTTFSSTTVFPSESTETSTVTMTTTAVNTPVKANKTDKDAAWGNSSERGFAPEPSRNKRYVAWAIVLGTAMAVTVGGLVAYMYLKSKRRKGFSHRKLVEEYPSDPVLRLDNTEPLDLNFSGWARYNPGLQGDNIQMTNFPERR